MITMHKPPILVPILLLLALGAATASAQPAAQPYAPPAAATTDGYASPDRARCEAELRKDAGWYAELKLQLKDDVHQDEYATFQRNNKHVIIAYAAIWVLTVGFAFLMWLRHGKLAGELARLKSDIARGAKDADA